MAKRYDTISELNDIQDASDILIAGDMGGENTGLLTFRAILDMLKVVLITLSLGILIYRFFISANPVRWWLTILTVLAATYIGWWVLRFLIRIYLQIRMTNPEFEWRPGGNYMMLNTNKAVWEGQSSFACPHCRSREHVYKLRLIRLHLQRAGYVPALFDPINPMHLAYNRKFRVPLTCPVTGNTFQGTLNYKQTALNALLHVEVQ